MEKPLRVRGQVLEGVIVSTRPQKTAIVKVEYVKKNTKYERMEKRRSRIPAHVPEGMKVEVGQKVRIGETRRISKTKSFVVLAESQ